MMMGNLVSGYVEELRETNLEAMGEIRTSEIYAMIFLVIKATSYLSLIDNIAPLMHIIVEIFNEIKYFMFIFVLFWLTFSTSFYILGKNQIQFDQLEPDELDGLTYKEFHTAFFYTW